MDSATTFSIAYELSLAGKTTILGANVTLACRNPIKCDKAASKIRNDSDFKGEVSMETKAVIYYRTQAGQG